MGAKNPGAIFHFTGSPENLIGILKNEFYPRYSLEQVFLGNEKVEVAFPMVCFCDIPLSQIKKHIEAYGCYGIGMTKDWATKKCLNPVLYLNKDSILTSNLKFIVSQIASTIRKLADDNKTKIRLEFANAIVGLAGYIKPYEGVLYRNNKRFEKVKFYEECEWRYVPYMDLNAINVMSKGDYEDGVARAAANLKAEKAKLSFEPDDIKYLIVREEREILSMVKSIREIKSKYDSNIVEILTSRVITCEQIIHDF
jgi:hypothetical protein